MHGPHCAPKRKMEIFGKTIDCTIGSVKNDFGRCFVDGGPNDHSQRRWLVSETYLSSARIRWHIVARHRPTLIGRVLFGRGMLVAFSTFIFPRRKRSSGVL